MVDGNTDYDALDERIEMLKSQVEETESIHEAEKFKIE
jgi:hypothetical protein